MKHTATGFTLIEALLVIGLLALIGILGVPFYQSFQSQSQLDSAVLTVMQSMTTARIESLSGKGNTDHGVHIEPHGIVLYTGSAYTPGHAENFSILIPDAVTLSASFGSDILFARRTGSTAQTGTLTISTLTTTHTLSINELGTIDQLN